MFAFFSLVHRIVHRLDFFDCVEASHHGHLIVNDANCYEILTFLKFVEVLSALVNDLLACGNEVAVVDKPQALEHDFQSF